MAMILNYMIFLVINTVAYGTVNYYYAHFGIGDEISVYCKFTPYIFNKLVFQWRLENTCCIATGFEINPNCTRNIRRYTLFNDVNKGGVYALRISNTTERDFRVYCCYVQVLDKEEVAKSCTKVTTAQPEETTMHFMISKLPTSKTTGEEQQETTTFESPTVFYQNNTMIHTDSSDEVVPIIIYSFCVVCLITMIALCVVYKIKLKHRKRLHTDIKFSEKT